MLRKIVTVQVTEDDIANGDKTETSNPIARAIKRAVPLFKVEEANEEFALIVGRNYFYEYEMPAQATGFLTDFFGGRKVWPFTFQLSERTKDKLG